MMTISSILRDAVERVSAQVVEKHGKNGATEDDMRHAGEALACRVRQMATMENSIARKGDAKIRMPSKLPAATVADLLYACFDVHIEKDGRRGEPAIDGEDGRDRLRRMAEAVDYCTGTAHMPAIKARLRILCGEG